MRCEASTRRNRLMQPAIDAALLLLLLLLLKEDKRRRSHPWKEKLSGTSKEFRSFPRQELGEERITKLYVLGCSGVAPSGVQLSPRQS